VARVISHYFYAKRAALENWGPNSPKYLGLSNLTLEEWFVSFQGKPNSPWRQDNNPNVFQFSRYWTPFHRRNDSTAMTQEDLDTAKRNLATFAIVGLAEEFNATLKLLNHALGWDLDPEEIQHRSINRASEEERQRAKNLDFPPKAIETIRKQNALDLELYEFGKCIFEYQLWKRNISRL
jgi:hypothetical protein